MSEKAVQAVIARFAGWVPGPSMLGFARSVSKEAYTQAERDIVAWLQACASRVEEPAAHEEGPTARDVLQAIATAITEGQHHPIVGEGI